MAANFKNLFNTKNKNHLFDNKSNEELRKLELQVCKPDILPKYVGEKPEKNPLSNRTVKLIFSDVESLELFGKYFKILTYVENNAPEIEMLVDFLKLLESGQLEYDAKERRFSWKT